MDKASPNPSNRGALNVAQIISSSLFSNILFLPVGEVRRGDGKD